MIKINRNIVTKKFASCSLLSLLNAINKSIWKKFLKNKIVQFSRKARKQEKVKDDLNFLRFFDVVA